MVVFGLLKTQYSLGLYVIGYIVALVISLCLHRKYHISCLRVFFYSLTIVYGFLCAVIGGKIYTFAMAARGFGGGSTSSIFGAVVFTPVLEIITVALEKQIDSRFHCQKERKEQTENQHPRHFGYAHTGYLFDFAIR